MRKTGFDGARGSMKYHGAMNPLRWIVLSELSSSSRPPLALPRPWALAA